MDLLTRLRNYFSGKEKMMAVEYVDVGDYRVASYDELRKRMNESNIEDLALPDVFAEQVKSIREGRISKD